MLRVRAESLILKEENVVSIDFRKKRKPREKVWDRQEKGSPEHDAIMVWLDENIEKAVDLTFPLAAGNC